MKSGLLSAFLNRFFPKSPALVSADFVFSIVISERCHWLPGHVCADGRGRALRDQPWPVRNFAGTARD
jgi:hypothetical protein